MNQVLGAIGGLIAFAFGLAIGGGIVVGVILLAKALW